MSAECTWTEMPHGDFRKYLQENIRQQECRQPNVSARNAQQRNTGKMKTVAVLETELSQVKEDNNAYESQVTSDVDLNTIKKLAIGRLGMNYPTDDQKKTYSMPSNSYVRQYQDVH